MSSTLITLALANLDRDPMQPRKTFDADSLKDLAASIAAEGIIQPIVVRENPNKEGHYLVVAGERRFRAAKKAKLTEVPVLVNTGIDLANIRSMQLNENFNRKDLTLLEIAQGIENFIKESDKKVTNAQLAKQFGRSSTYWSRVRKLNGAPESLRKEIESGTITNINVISDFISLFEVDQETYNDVFADMKQNNIPGNLEKYVAVQVRMAKEIKKFGFVLPTANAHGVYSDDEPGVKVVSFEEDHVSLKVSALQISAKEYVFATSVRAFTGYTGGPLTAHHPQNSMEECFQKGLKNVATYLASNVERDTSSKAYGRPIKNAFEWLNEELRKAGCLDYIPMPQPPQKQKRVDDELSHQESDCAAGSGDTIERDITTGHDCATGNDITTDYDCATDTDSDTDGDAVLQNNVVSITSNKPLNDCVTMQIPEVLQEDISRLLGYYYAVSDAMSESEARNEVHSVITQLAGEPQPRAIH
ncbi:ParB/RepB/Spo0J family partition protein [Vibrio mediterranei]|uniref:ParB-like N-terminal domain-containing protein n=1 Tax=Vibrio mediterranei TaxID=689 RepID=A0ABX5D791_9VIBR|nr:ParB/RepB/Spo0J family partition protein [Vibrio mediterranei]PRQ65133.1 hypothetical protein COR51_23720 [Vibrio mediterranei]